MKKAIVRAIKGGRKTLAIAFAIGVLLGVPLARMMPAIYTASMTVTASRYSADMKPNAPTTTVSILSTSSGGQLSDFDLYLQLLTSNQVAAALFKHDPNLVHQLFRDEWDGSQWTEPATFSFFVKKTIFSLVGAPAWSPPSPLRLSQLLTAMLVINKTLQSPIATVSVRLPDRALGITLLKAVDHETEAAMKEQAYRMSREKVKYLSEFASNAPAGVGDAMVQTEVRSLVAATLTQSPVPFGAEFISSPDAPSIPDRKPLLLIPLVTGALTTLFAFGALLYFRWQRLGFPLPPNLAWIRG